MILNFTIENFKSINEPITLSFEPIKKGDNIYPEYYIYKTPSGLEILKMAVIYGANATGKTNILKALNFLRNLVLISKIDRNEEINYKPFLFTEKKKNSSFELEFIQNDIRYLYNIEFNNKKIISEELFFFKPNRAKVFSRKTLEDGTVEIKFGTKIKVKKFDRYMLERNTLPNITTFAGYSRTNIVIEEIKNSLDWFENKLKPLIEPRTDLTIWSLEKLEEKEINKEHIIQILRNADFNISDFIVEEEDIDTHLEKKNIYGLDKEIIKLILKTLKSKADAKDSETIKELYFEHTVKNKKYLLSYDDESAGTQRFYQLAIPLNLMLKEDLIFPIDELEASLHPDLIKHFLKLFLYNTKGRATQVIFTTHYRELLLEKELLRKDIIWFTEKKDDYSTELYSLADFKTDQLRKEHSVYKAYKYGKLGAVPYLKSFILED